jgi:hypothetical protein
MILILIVGGGLGWARHRANQQRDVVAAIKRANGFAWYDWEWKDGDWVQSKKWQPPGPRWLVDRIGVDYVSNITFVNTNGRGSDEALIHFGNLDRLERLSLHGTPVTDAGLECLRGLACLRVLDLDDTFVTDEGLACLKGMTRLKFLSLEGTRVTDAGIRELQKSLPKLQVKH